MMNIESLWKEYVTFEQSINPMIAEKLTQERSRDYMNARRVAKEYEAVTRGLNKTHPSVPPTGMYLMTSQLVIISPPQVHRRSTSRWSCGTAISTGRRATL